MNSLSIFSAPTTTSQAVTMSSREIAELTGKEHRNVMRDIRAMLRDLYEDAGMLGFEHTEINTQNGVAYPVFMLPKRETLILVSGYSTELRTRIKQLEEMLAAVGAGGVGPLIPSKLTARDIADSALLGNIESPFNACMHQEHCKRWKKEAEAEQQFSARDDAERLKSVARGMSYNDHGEAVWKHTLMEIAVRLEAGGYAAPQPPTVKDSLTVEQQQIEQEPLAWIRGSGLEMLKLENGGCATVYASDGMSNHSHPLYTRPQPKPLTDEAVLGVAKSIEIQFDSERLNEQIDDILAFARAIERAHGIGGDL